ncbi:MAG: ABC transporter ATP-binding protein [Acidobacteriota bacterium]
MSWTRNNEWLTIDQEHSISWQNLRRFLRHYRKARANLALAAALALFGAAAAFFIPVVFREVQAAMSTRAISLLAWSLAGFLGIMLAEVATSYGVQKINSRVATRLNRDLVLRYYGKILNLSVEDFIAFRRRTNLFQRIIDAMSITSQFTSILVRGGQLLIAVLVVGVVIGLVSPTILGVLAVGAVVLFAHALIQARKLAALRSVSLGVNYPLVGKMTEVLGGLFTIKALAASVAVTSDVKGLVDKKTGADYDEQLAEVRSNQITQALRIVTLVVALGVACALALQGRLLIAEVFALYLLTNLFLQPVTELAIYYQLLSRLSVNVGKFYEVLDLPDEAEAVRAAVAARAAAPLVLPAAPTASAPVAERPSAQATATRAHPVLVAPARPALDLALSVDEARARGHIVFDNVDFAYRDGKQVLSGVDLEIRPGEKVSLIGRSGVGKTTLMRLLLGFLQPQQGRILVDGVEVTTMEDKNAYRRNFGVVSQQDFLFGTSIRENLMFGLEHTVEETRMREALELVNLWDDVDGLSQGLDAPYSDDLFSGGQKQRFFIARALLRDPSIVLLDEPTSALDFESESQVMNALDRLVGENTTITIAHRLSTVQNADRVIVLRDGRIQAMGTHDELYRGDDYYRSLCDYNSFVV